MLSFIIIGRNEGRKLTRCFESVFATILANKLISYEIIYVDSNSSDDSISRAKAFPGVKIFQITGTCNAAIARNIGAFESKGADFFFIDGDMEINPEFLQLVYEQKVGLKYDFASGKWVNYNYNTSGELISKEQYIEGNQNDKYEYTTGGLFLIKRELWQKVHGMKNKMRFNEDLDLGLRLAKKGFFLLKKEELISIHHTVPHNDKKRIWKLMFSGAQLYRIVLIRDNFLNKYAWKLFLRGNYTFLILLASLILSFLFSNPYLLIIYFASVFVRTYGRKETSLRLILSNLIYLSTYEMSLIFGLFLFWPTEKKFSEYNQVKL